MHYVLLGIHDPDICPMSNSKTRDLMMQSAPQIPKLAESNGVKLVAGPYVNREHTTVIVVEATSSEDLDRFLLESRLAQWNSVRVLPSRPLEEGIAEIQEQPAIF